MSALTDNETRAIDRRVSTAWWLFLITGIAWVVIAFMVLAVDPSTPAMIGYLVGFMLIVAALNEFMAVPFVPAWKWLHVVLGVSFFAVGIMALLEPFQTFGILALLIGWYLLFKGIADMTVSIVARDDLPLWGVRLASGILEVAIGVWALGYPGRSAWLLIIWVGLAALVRGITEIALAFTLRGAATGTPASR